MARYKDHSTKRMPTKPKSKVRASRRRMGWDSADKFLQFGFGDGSVTQDAPLFAHQLNHRGSELTLSRPSVEDEGQAFPHLLVHLRRSVTGGLFGEIGAGACE